MRWRLGGEAGHDDPCRGVPEDPFEGLDQVALGAAVALPFGVGGVAEEEQDPFTADLGEAGEVGRPALRRIVVELEVARVDDHPGGRVDGEGGGVGDAVADRDQLDPERPELEAVAHPRLAEVGLAQDPVLFQLRLDEPESEPGPINRHVEALEHEGEGADVVLMAVGEDDPEHLLVLPEQVADVGDDEVDPGHVLAGEHKARVDDQDLVVPFQGPHVAADLAQPAEGDVAELQIRLSCCGSAGGSGSGSGGGGGVRMASR